MASLLPSSLTAAFHAARSYLTPTLKTSGLSEGQLSPEEFVRAGDYLIRMAPAWRWERGDTAKAKSYLPPDKQFLVTKGVPCRHRVRALQASASDTAGSDREVRLEHAAVGSEAWFEPAVGGRTADSASASAGDDEIDELPGSAAYAAAAAPGAASPQASAAASAPVAGAAGSAVAASAASALQPASNDDDDEYGDLSTFMDRSLIVHDPAAVGGGMAATAPPAVTTSAAGSAGGAVSAAPAAVAGSAPSGSGGHGREAPASAGAAGAAAASSTGAASGMGGEEELRLYDLCLVYDNVYRTPRVYLKGYTEAGAPLGADAMLEDVMQDYVSRTATIEAHPHLGSGSSSGGGGGGGGGSGSGSAGASDGSAASASASAATLPSHHYVSIHPCRHAQAMKRIIESMSEGAAVAASVVAGGAGAPGDASATPAAASSSSAAGSSNTGAPAAGSPALPPSVSVEMYDFIFLKFVATMMPTLEYDNTLAVSGGAVGR